MLHLSLHHNVRRPILNGSAAELKFCEAFNRRYPALHRTKWQLSHISTVKNREQRSHILILLMFQFKLLPCPCPRISLCKSLQPRSQQWEGGGAMPSRDFQSALKFYCRQIARLSDWQITRFSGFSDCQISKVEKIYEEIQKNCKLWIFYAL